MISLKDIKVESQKSLANFTTWKIGGPAQWFAEPKNINEINLLLSWIQEKKIPCNVIGAGSNLLINDSGLDGVSLCTRKLKGSLINSSDGIIEAFSGEPIPKLASQAAKAGLAGLEWAVGIPGTVGGAVVMNAGAQGGCIGEKILSVNVVPEDGGQSFSLSNKELDFSYRNSLIQREKLIVLSARFQLEPGGNSEEISRLTNENLKKRKNSQPYHLPSCGSVFRNPEPLKAGQIIESLGLKGTSIGGAEISKMHANFIVNTCDASAKDVCNLIKMIQQKVKEKYGFVLHPELKRLGF